MEERKNVLFKGVMNYFCIGVMISYPYVYEQVRQLLERTFDSRLIFFQIGGMVLTGVAMVLLSKVERPLFAFSNWLVYLALMWLGYGQQFFLKEGVFLFLFVLLAFFLGALFRLGIGRQEGKMALPVTYVVNYLSLGFMICYPLIDDKITDLYYRGFEGGLGFFLWGTMALLAISIVAISKVDESRFTYSNFFVFLVGSFLVNGEYFLFAKSGFLCAAVLLTLLVFQIGRRLQAGTAVPDKVGYISRKNNV